MQKLLDGKVALITGVANEFSIAWGIARAFHEQGARLAFTYQNEKAKEHSSKLIQPLHPEVFCELDVTKDADIASVVRAVDQAYGKLDILIHSLAFAPKEDLQNDFYKTSRAGFALANEISAYSLIALSKAFLPLFEKAAGGSIVYMTFIGAESAIATYRVMGVSKAALEASGKYLAQSLGPRNIRVNGISAGPIKTLAAHGIQHFSELQQKVAAATPLPGEMTPDDISGTALYLASDLSSAVTGEVIHVDKGFHCVRS